MNAYERIDRDEFDDMLNNYLKNDSDDDIRSVYEQQIRNSYDPLHEAENILEVDEWSVLRIVEKEDFAHSDETEEEDRLLQSLSPKDRQRYIKLKAKEESIGAASNYKHAQYEAIQRVLAGEKTLLDKQKPIRPQKTIRTRPRTKEITEKEAVQSIYRVLKPMKMNKGFSIATFDIFYSAYRAYKSKLKKAAVTFLQV